MSPHPIDRWTLYAHAQATSNTYMTSYKKVAAVDTLEAWGALWRHCHPEIVGRADVAVAIHGLRVMAWSFFRDDVQPKWEDAANVDGSTLTHRSNVGEVDASRVWTQLVVECARGALPDAVLGVQVTQKPVRHTTFVKFDVWLAARADQGDVRARLRDACGLEFAPSQRGGAPPPPSSLGRLRRTH